jgi:archaellum component FlaF (FlaF/FlaG flagellin family)
MKPLLIIPFLAFASCSSVDVLIDKSQIKGETQTHYLAPSSAVTPVVNSDELNQRIGELIIRATK